LREAAGNAWLAYRSELETAVRDYYEVVWSLRPLEEEESRPEPPEDLLRLIAIEDWNIPPAAGGYLDQPALTLKCLTICRNIRDEVAEVKRQQDKVNQEALELMNGSAGAARAAGSPNFNRFS
jgi:hypothetical protein